MQDSIHDAVLAHGGRCDLHRETEVEEAIRLDQRTIRIGDLIGLGIEKVERVKLHRPAIVEVVACATVDDARHGRSKRIVFGERCFAQVTPADTSVPSELLPEGDAGGCDNGWCAGNEIARRITDLGLGKPASDA